MSGLRTYFGFWAPQHLTLMNGPSRWMAGTFAYGIPASAYFLAFFAALTSSPCETVSVVGRTVVTPSWSFALANSKTAFSSASQKS